MTRRSQRILPTGMTAEEAVKKYSSREPEWAGSGARITNNIYIQGEGLDPDEVTKILGISPTRSSRTAVTKGKFVPSGKPNVIPPHWVFSVSKYDCYEMEEGLVEILDMIWPRRDALLRFVEKGGHRVRFTVGILIKVDRPVYALSPDTVKRLGFFEAGYIVDIHDLSE